MVAELRKLPFVVTKVEKRQRQKRPGAPFTTSTLQQEAAKKLGFSSRRTMRAAQDLYEGIDVGEDGAGRSHHLHADRLGAGLRHRDRRGARLHRTNYAKPYLPESPNAYTSKAAARAGCPRGDPPDRRAAAGRSRSQPYLEPDQFRLYQLDLAALRGVADEPGGLRHDRSWTSIWADYLLRATGSVLVFDGYHVLYTEGREAEEGKTMDDLPPIPPLARATGWRSGRSRPTQHFTEPPPRFSEASLVKELERLGIGRPVDLRAIIPTLTAREYVQLEQRRFFPPSWARRSRRSWWPSFPAIFNVEFTSEMETELDRIEEGSWAGSRCCRTSTARSPRRCDAVDLNAIVAEAHGLKSEELAKERCPKCGVGGRAPAPAASGPTSPASSTRTSCDYAEVAAEAARRRTGLRTRSATCAARRW